MLLPDAVSAEEDRWMEHIRYADRDSVQREENSDDDNASFENCFPVL
jgi:hypothetical protein